MTKGTEPSVAHAFNPILSVVTPLRWQRWESELAAAGCLSEFSDVPLGIREGFRVGTSSNLCVSYQPRNHKSARDNPSIIRSHINTELVARRYTGPFHPSRL